MYKLVVLLSVAALATANPGALLTPVTYNAVLPGHSSISQYSTNIVHGSPAVVPPPVYTVPQAVYSVPVAYKSAVVTPVGLAQAPHSPAIALDPVHGVPLDTPEVVAARAAHYQTKALSGIHHVGKRSAGVVLTPLTYPRPLTYPTPVLTYPSHVVPAYSPGYPKVLSVHPY